MSTWETIPLQPLSQMVNKELFPCGGGVPSHRNNLQGLSLSLQRATEGNGLSWQYRSSFPGVHLCLQHTQRCKAQTHNCRDYELLLLSCCSSTGVYSHRSYHIPAPGSRLAPCSGPTGAACGSNQPRDKDPWLLGTHLQGQELQPVGDALELHRCLCGMQRGQAGSRGSSRAVMVVLWWGTRLRCPLLPQRCS